jgi:hypothetical protein
MNSNKNKFFTLPLLEDYSSRREWEEACWNKITDIGDVSNLVITLNERHNLIMRAAAAEKINSGMGTSQIAKELFLSRQTVNTIRKAIKSNEYKSYRERGKMERKKKVYTPSMKKDKKYRGRPIRTKYGTIYSKYF